MTYHGKMKQVSYRDPGVNSDKWYRAYVIQSDNTPETRVLFQWGRVNATGQAQMAVFTDPIAAQAAVDRKLGEKEGKGYSSNRPDDGVTFFDVIPKDILLKAGITDTDMPTPVGVPELTKATFADFRAEIDRCRRLSMGTQEETTASIMVRNDLRDQLQALRSHVAEAEGQLEFVEQIMQMRMTSA